jgi:hypothetical protein
MPVRPPTWALVLLGTIVIWLGTRALWTSGSQIDPTPVPGRSNGEPTFRQRLVAIGDLHGGMSSYWLVKTDQKAYVHQISTTPRESCEMPKSLMTITTG